MELKYILYTRSNFIHSVSYPTMHFFYKFTEIKRIWVSNRSLNDKTTVKKRKMFGHYLALMARILFEVRTIQCTGKAQKLLVVKPLFRSCKSLLLNLYVWENEIFVVVVLLWMYIFLSILLYIFLTSADIMKKKRKINKIASITNMLNLLEIFKFKVLYKCND